MSLVTHNIMNNSICTLFDNILIDIHKFKSLRIEKTCCKSPCQANDALKRPVSVAKGRFGVSVRVDAGAGVSEMKTDGN